MFRIEWNYIQLQNEKNKTPRRSKQLRSNWPVQRSVLSPAAFEHIWFKQPVLHSNRSEGYTVLRHYYHLMVAKGRKGK